MFKVSLLFEELISSTSIYWVLMCIKYDSLQLLWQIHEPLPSWNLHSSEEEGLRIIGSGETSVLRNREVRLSFSVVLSRDLSELRERVTWMSEEEHSRQSEWQMQGPCSRRMLRMYQKLTGTENGWNSEVKRENGSRWNQRDSGVGVSWPWRALEIMARTLSLNLGDMESHGGFLRWRRSDMIDLYF